MALAPLFKAVRPVIGLVGASLSLTCSIWMGIWAAQYLPTDAQAAIGVLFASFYAFWIVTVLTFAAACAAMLIRRVC